LTFNAKLFLRNEALFNLSVEVTDMSKGTSWACKFLVSFYFFVLSQGLGQEGNFDRLDVRYLETIGTAEELRDIAFTSRYHFCNLSRSYDAFRMKEIYEGTGTGTQNRTPSEEIIVPTADQIREEGTKMKSERDSAEKIMDFKSFESPFDDFDAFQ
jgi:hypothetical protein